MKKFAIILVFSIIFVTAFVSTTGCTDKRPTPSDSVGVDSIQSDSTAADTLETLITEQPMPKSADELFDDFFFNFIANKKLQRSRINFPLPVLTGNKKVELQKGQWKTDHFFRPQGYYTLVFDNEEQMKYPKSTDLDSVIVEKIHLKKGTIEQYWFDHQEGKWRLNEIRNISFKDSYNASFFKFLSNFFATRGAGAIKNPLAYSGPDPDGEETTTVNRTIPAEEWSTFLPEVPGGMIYNILYGQKYSETNRKILTFRGLSNGVETQLIFKRHGQKWRLEKINAY